MRVLVKSKDGITSVIGVESIAYSDEITLGGKTISGLEIEDLDGDFFCIAGLSKETCNMIAEEVFRKGYIDLTEYHSCEYEDIV